MSKEKCQECQRVFTEIKDKHPEWGVEERLKLAAETLKNFQEAYNCGRKRCLPAEQANRTLTSMEIVQMQMNAAIEQKYMQTARGIVEDVILDQVKGHPDKFTAFSAARGCGCNSCVREYNEWVEVYAEKHPELLQLKKPLRGERHVIWNPDSDSGV
jgi:hypothetical protein